MKKENQIKKRKALNELIQEIVNEQVEMMLLEYASGSEGALYTVFIQPFLDTANVIKGEVGKVGANLTGNFAKGLVSALSVLLPMLDKVPFTEKTWDQAINAIEARTAASIKNIAGRYSNSYNAVKNSFSNPDLAFLAFSFNPGLYLGSFLAAHSLGGTLSAAASALGTDRTLTNAYGDFLSRIGIFTPGFKPQGGGVSIDVGMGGYGDSAGGLEENFDFKNYISILIENEIDKSYFITKILKEKIRPGTAGQLNPARGQLGLGATPPVPVNKKEEERINNWMNLFIEAIRKHSIQLDDPTSEALRQGISQNQDDATLATKLKTLQNAKLQNIINLEDLTNIINQSPKTKKIIAAASQNVANELIEQIKNSREKYPATIEEFFKKLDDPDTSEELKEKARELIDPKGTGTFQDLLNKNENEVKALKEKYATIVKAANSRKEDIPKNIEEMIRQKFNSKINGQKIVPDDVIKDIIAKIKAGLEQ